MITLDIYFNKLAGNGITLTAKQPFSNSRMLVANFAYLAQAMNELEISKDLAEPVLIRIFTMADWMRNQNEEGVEPPMPPMAVDPAIRIPELKNVLKQYGVDGYFTTFPA